MHIVDDGLHAVREEPLEGHEAAVRRAVRVPAVVEHVASGTTVPPDGVDVAVAEYRLTVFVPSHTTRSLPSPLDPIVPSFDTPIPNQPHPAHVTSNSMLEPVTL